MVTQQIACQLTEDICTNLPYNNISDDPIYYKYPPVGCSIYEGCQANINALLLNMELLLITKHVMNV